MFIFFSLSFLERLKINFSNLKLDVILLTQEEPAFSHKNAQTFEVYYLSRQITYVKIKNFRHNFVPLWLLYCCFVFNKRFMFLNKLFATFLFSLALRPLIEPWKSISVSDSFARRLTLE